MSNNLPQGWVLTTLDEITEINPKHSSNIDSNVSVTFVPMSAASETHWSFQHTDERPLGEVRKGYTHFAEGDVLFAKITPCMENGKAAVARGLKNGLGCGSTEFHVLRPKCGIEAKFVYHYLHQERFRREAARNFTGTAGQLRVPVAFIRAAEIPLAPVEEQRRITATLEKLLDRLEDSNERLEMIPVILKRFRQSVLAAACSGRLTADWREANTRIDSSTNLIREERFQMSEPEGGLADIPEKWSWVALGNYGFCSRGRFSVRPRNDPRYFGGKYPFIQIGSLPPEGGWIVSHTQTLNEKGLAVSKLFSKGTAVIAIVGATIGNTGLLAYEMCFTDSMVGIETSSEIGNRYVELFLRSKKYEIRQGSYSSGGQPNISLEVLNPYPLALPPYEEQQEIVNRVDNLFVLADQIEARYLRAKAHVNKLTPSVLAKAFRGELVAQDPNDEPAGVLLERIRASKKVNSK